MKLIAPALAKLASRITAGQGGAMPLLLLAVIWGGFAYGWGTLGDYAVQQRIPAVLGSTERFAQQIDIYLNERLNLLDTLATDARIPSSLAKAEGLGHQDVRRALYEFSYINRLPQVYVWHGATSQLAMPATADDPADDVRTWLASLVGQTRSLHVSGLNQKPVAYLATRIEAVKDGSAYAVLRQSWPYLLTNMPSPEGIEGFSDSTHGLITRMYGTPWWAGTAAEAKGKPMSIPPSLIDADRDYTTLADGSVLVVARLLRFENWSAAALLPGAAAVGETMRTVQWGILGLAIFLTLIALWRPTLPLRLRAAHWAKPLTDRITPALQPLAPLAARIAAISRGEKSSDAIPLAAPGSFSKDDFADPRRARAPGSAAFKPRPKPSTSTAPDLGAIATTAGSPVSVPASSLTSNTSVTAPATSPPNTPMAKLIEDCLNTDRTRLLYQPVYRANDGFPIMHEVYLRLLDEDEREISPVTFFPTAEKLGWTPRLDAHVFQRLMQLHFGGGNMPSTPLAINLSGTTLESIGYLEMLMNMSNTPIMQNLVFEVRSQELMKDPHTLRFLHECQEMGVKLTVDYFGGGAAMIEAIKRLNFDFVKMDAMRFGKSDITKKELINLCRTAQRVGLPVILEKVENVTMEVFARRTAIPFLQGYLFAKPTHTLVDGPMPGWRTVGQELATQPPVQSPNAAESTEAPLPPVT